MSGKQGYEVLSIASLAGEALILRKGITRRDLTRAIDEYRKREGVRIGTLIGVSEDGVVASDREGWHPGLPDAFGKPFIIIPWVQILECLGRVPSGTTGKLLGADENPAERGDVKTIKVSDATYRAIADEAILPFRSTAMRDADGAWLVPISHETWERIQAEKLPGESDDDTVMRILRGHGNLKPN